MQSWASCMVTSLVSPSQVAQWPQPLITASRSSTLTRSLPQGCGATSAGHGVGAAGQAPQALMTARRSSTLTLPPPVMSGGQVDAM